MKITRRQLRRIISEELSLLSEGMYAAEDVVKKILNKDGDLSDKEIRAVLGHLFYSPQADKSDHS